MGQLAAAESRHRRVRGNARFHTLSELSGSLISDLHLVTILQTTRVLSQCQTGHTLVQQACCACKCMHVSIGLRVSPADLA